MDSLKQLSDANPLNRPAAAHAKTPNGDSNSVVPNPKAHTGVATPTATASGEPGPGGPGDRLHSADSQSVRESFAGYAVHPFASRFPLIEGTEFDELVESIQNTGTVVPIEIHEGQLIDGRNRARAVEELRHRGLVVELPTVEWRPQGFETVEEHIYALNVHRRHLTDDQRAVFATSMLPGIRAAREARQAKTRFSGRAPVAGKTKPPDSPRARERSSRTKAAASSTGQLATAAKVSHHKAGQAIALADAVESGLIPPADLESVQRGEKRLRDVAPNKRKTRPPKTPRSDNRAVKAGDAAGFWFDGEAARTEDRDVNAGSDGDACDAPNCTEEEVRRRWERFKRPFAIADHRALRRLTAMIIAAEQKKLDRST